jgi:acetyl esterase
MEKKLPHLESITAQFIEALKRSGAAPIYTMAIPDARKFFDTAQTTVLLKTGPTTVQDITVPVGPTGEVLIRIFRPESASEKLPVIVYFHGGGWILGSKESFDRLMRDIAYDTHAAVVFVNYARSPEAQYPVALEQAYAATKYIAEQGEKYDLDSRRLAIAGDSVGGNMAAIVAILAKERRGPKIDFQVLFYPVTDGTMSSQSYEEFAEGPWLTKRAMEWFWDAYQPNKEKRKLFTVSPLYAKREQLHGLPPALVITDENDVLRDEGESYAHSLMDAGVPVLALRYLGTIHDFVLLNALRETPASKSALSVATSTLRNLFYGNNK